MYILSLYLISVFSVCVIQGYPSLHLVILDGMYISAPLTMAFQNIHYSVHYIYIEEFYLLFSFVV